MTATPQRPMPPRRLPVGGRGHRFAAHLALLGMLLAALAPGVSHWLARDDASSLWRSLCRQPGIDRPDRLPAALRLADAQTGQRSPEGLLQRLDACGYCVLQANMTNPPSAAPATAPTASPAPAPIGMTVHAPGGAVRVAPLPRGPPAPPGLRSTPNA
ncbi:MAG: DUF2946 family protein [Lautropia sp.]